jgi:hypothetical protein
MPALLGLCIGASFEMKAYCGPSGRDLHFINQAAAIDMRFYSNDRATLVVLVLFLLLSNEIYPSCGNQ